MTVVLRLYVAGKAPNSVAARRALKRIVEQSMRDDIEVEIVDVFAEPQRAMEDGILVTPTLLRISPGPTWTIVGNLADGDRVTALLELVEES